MYLLQGNDNSSINTHTHTHTHTHSHTHTHTLWEDAFIYPDVKVPGSLTVSVCLSRKSLQCSFSLVLGSFITIFGERTTTLQRGIAIETKKVFMKTDVFFKSKKKVTADIKTLNIEKSPQN